MILLNWSHDNLPYSETMNVWWFCQTVFRTISPTQEQCMHADVAIILIINHWHTVIGSSYQNISKRCLWRSTHNLQELEYLFPSKQNVTIAKYSVNNEMIIAHKLTAINRWMTDSVSQYQKIRNENENQIQQYGHWHPVRTLPSVIHGNSVTTVTKALNSKHRN